jgi:hypothetical protein
VGPTRREGYDWKETLTCGTDKKRGVRLERDIDVWDRQEERGTTGKATGVPT